MDTSVARGVIRAGWLEIEEESVSAAAPSDAESSAAPASEVEEPAQPTEVAATPDAGGGEAESKPAADVGGTGSVVHVEDDEGSSGRRGSTGKRVVPGSDGGGKSSPALRPATDSKEDVGGGSLTREDSSVPLRGRVESNTARRRARSGSIVSRARNASITAARALNVKPSGPEDMDTEIVEDASMRLDQFEDSTTWAPLDRVFVTFNFRLFVQMFLIHVFFPLSGVVVWLAWGKQAAVNLHMLPRCSALVLFHSYLMPLLLISLNLSLLSPEYDVEKGGPYRLEIALANSLYVLRAAVIAFKYGWVSEGEWANFKHASTPAALRFQRDLQLLSGWLYPSARTLHRELNDSATRLRVPLSLMKMEFQNNADARKRMHKLLAAVPERDVVRLGYNVGRHSVDVLYLGTALVRAASVNQPASSTSDEASAKMVKRMNQIGWFVAGAQSALPFLNRSSGEVDFLTTENTVMSVISFLVRGYYYMILYSFLLCAVYDYHRRYIVFHKMTKLIVPWPRRKAATAAAGKQSAAMAFTWDMPLLDIGRPKVALSWYRLRLVLQDFGLRYHYRLQAYATLGVVVMVALVASAFTAALNEDSLSAFQQGELALLLRTTMFNIVVVFGIVIVIIVFGDWANEETNLQEDALVRKELELAESLGTLEKEFDSETMARINSSRQVLRHVRKGLRTMDRYNPIMLLQVRADRTLLQGIALGSGTILGVAARMLTSKVTPSSGTGVSGSFDGSS